MNISSWIIYLPLQLYDKIIFHTHCVENKNESACCIDSLTLVTKLQLVYFCAHSSQNWNDEHLFVTVQTGQFVWSIYFKYRFSCFVVLVHSIFKPKTNDKLSTFSVKINAIKMSILCIDMLHKSFDLKM